MFDGKEKKKREIRKDKQLKKSFAPGKIEKVRKVRDVKFHLGNLLFLD